MSVQVSYKKQFTLFICLLLIFIITVEIIFQTIDILPKECKMNYDVLFDDLSKYEQQILCNEYTFGSGKVSYTSDPIRVHLPNQHGSYVNINSEGFRGKELDFSEKDYKIFFLGGSTAFGFVTSSDETTISSQIEKKIQSYGINVKVINAGIIGSASIDEYYFVENKLLKYDPDMIIMYDGYNDVGDFDFKKFHISYDEFKNNNAIINNNQYDVGNEISNKGSGIIMFFEKINYKSGLGIANGLKLFADKFSSDGENKLESLTNHNKKDVSPEIVRFIEGYMTKSWSDTCSLGKINGFQTVNILQPMLGTSDRVFHISEQKMMSEEKFPSYYLENLKNIQIDSEKIKPCEYFYDLRHSFDNLNEIPIYVDEGHMSDFGYEMIAENISQRILPIILEDISK
jgi:hypothetical protein